MNSTETCQISELNNNAEENPRLIFIPAFIGTFSIPYAIWDTMKLKLLYRETPVQICKVFSVVCSQPNLVTNNVG